MGLFHRYNIANPDIHPFSSFLDFIPVAPGRLLGLVVAVLIVAGVHQVVGQILLFHPAVGIVVGIAVALLPLKARAVGVDVLQLPGEAPSPPGAHIGDRPVDGHTGCVGLGRGSQHNAGLRQRKPRLRQPQLQRRVHAGLDDGHRLGIGKADVLAGRAENPPGGANQVARLQQPRQIMHRRVRVGAPQGLHQRRETVKMLVPIPVIAHGTALGHSSGILQCDAVGGRGKQQLHRVQGLAHVAAAGRRNPRRHAILQPQGCLPPAVGDLHRPAHRLLRLLGGDGLELKDRGAAQNGVEHAEIGVFRGGSDQRDASVFNEFQQRLLLFFVEILDLVQIQQHTSGGQQRIQLVDDALDVRDSGGGGVELAQAPVGSLGDDARHRGLSGAGGAVKNHIGDLAALHDAAQQTVGAENMPLPYHVLQGLGPNLVCQRLVHGAHLPNQPKIKLLYHSQPVL